MPRFNIFYGWRIVAVGFVSLLLAGGIGYYTFSAFIIPISNDFGWSRAEISLAMTVASLVGLAAPLVGMWVDRYGARSVMAAGALITGGAFALLGFSTSLWYFYAFYFFMALGQLGALNIPIARVVSSWFDKKRGLAIGITLSGFGIGGLTMLPLASYLISVLGWRMAYHILGLIILIVLTPLSMLVIRERPAEMDLSPDGKTSEEMQTKTPLTDELQASATWTLSSALRTKTFWLITGALSLTFLGTGAIIAHLVPFFQDQGISHQMASTILALAIGVSVFGRVTAGYLVDKVPIKYMVMLCFLLQIGGLALILLGTGSMAVVWAFVVVFGLGIGGIFALEPLLVSQYFGLISFGAIYGGLWAFITIATATGPFIAGYIFDVTGNYDMAFILSILITSIALILIFLLGPPKPSRLDLSPESKIR